jgi:uncharacterized protein YjbI with pentapeptide repeats
MDPVKLLQAEDVAAFNQLRAARRGEKLDLFAEDLSGLDLQGIELSGVHLDKSDLTGTNLAGGRLIKATACDIDAVGLDLRGVVAAGAKLRDAFLEDAVLTGADLSNAELSGATLTRSVGVGVKLPGARLKGASLGQARWPGADLAEASLADADVSGAVLSGANLRDAKAHGVKGAGAKLDRVDAGGAHFGKAQLAGADLSGAQLAGASLAGADLTGADLRGATLTRADLTGANLTGAQLAGARLADAVLEDALLEGADLTGADLSGVDVLMLGLNPAQVASLAAAGVVVDPGAPRMYDEAVVAVVGATVGVLWINPDSEERTTLRWAVQRGELEATGVLDVSASQVVAHTILARPSGFALIAVVERSHGHAVVRWDLSTEGARGAGVVTRLGFEPSVLPVFEADGPVVRMVGVGRRGPTVHVLVDAGEGFAPVSSDPRPQALGFLGEDAPVLLCKAGILMPVRKGALGAPLRAPDGFPPASGPTVAVAAPDGRVWTSWVAAKGPREPGGMRGVWVGDRHKQEPERLGENPNVTSLSAVVEGDGVLVAWLEEARPRAVEARFVHVPGGAPSRVPIGPGQFTEIRCVPGVSGGGVAIGNALGDLAVVGTDGRVLAVFEAASGSA